MSTPEHDPKPDPILPPDGPQEIIRHALGSKDDPSGKPIDSDEERRRLRALELHAELLLAKHGLKPSKDEPLPVDASSGTLAAEIRAASEVVMEKQDAKAKALFDRTHIKVNKQDGTTIEVSNTRISLLGPLGACVDSLIVFVRGVFHGRFSMRLKTGKRGTDLSVEGEGAGRQDVFVKKE